MIFPKTGQAEPIELARQIPYGQWTVHQIWHPNAAVLALPRRRVMVPVTQL